MNDKIKCVCLASVILAIPTAVSGHHSSAEYDQTVVIELEGEIANVLWRNPHVMLEFAADDDAGETWELEGAALSSQRRRGVTPDLVEVGDRVRVAGYPSTRRDRHMLTEHVLLPDGMELLLGSTREPRWSDVELGSSAWTVDPSEAARAQGNGLFRVWSRGAGVRPWYFREPSEFALTDSALVVAASFDPFEDNPVLDCTAPGMPALMGNPYPMEFVEMDNGMEIRYEEFDAVRTIHLDATRSDANIDSSPLGYSVGRWEGDTLAVTTTWINWPHFGRIGIPQTEAVEVVELFTVIDNGNRLDYQLTIFDPGVLLEPFSWEAHWVWRPGERLESYNCTL